MKKSINLLVMMMVVLSFLACSMEPQEEEVVGTQQSPSDWQTEEKAETYSASKTVVKDGYEYTLTVSGEQSAVESVLNGFVGIALTSESNSNDSVVFQEMTATEADSNRIMRNTNASLSYSLTSKPVEGTTSVKANIHDYLWRGQVLHFYSFQWGTVWANVGCNGGNADLELYYFDGRKYITGSHNPGIASEHIWFSRSGWFCATYDLRIIARSNVWVYGNTSLPVIGR